MELTVSSSLRWRNSSFCSPTCLCLGSAIVDGSLFMVYAGPLEGVVEASIKAYLDRNVVTLHE